MFTEKPAVVNQMNLRAVALSICYWNIYQPPLLSNLWNTGPPTKHWACPPNPRKLTGMYRSLKATLAYLLLTAAGHKIQVTFQILLSIHSHGTDRWISPLWVSPDWDNISLTIIPTGVLLVFQYSVLKIQPQRAVSEAVITKIKSEESLFVRWALKPQISGVCDYLL